MKKEDNYRQVQIRFTDADYKRLRDYIDANRQTAAGWIRSLVMEFLDKKDKG